MLQLLPDKAPRFETFFKTCHTFLASTA
jgi:hypothetical protein